MHTPPLQTHEPGAGTAQAKPAAGPWSTTLTQLPQARAAALIATAQSIGAVRAREIGGTPAEQALTAAKAEAAQLRGYVHSLCFEAHELRAARPPQPANGCQVVQAKLGAASVAVEFTTVGQDVVITAAHINGEWVSACPGESFTPEVLQAWEKAAAAHLQALVAADEVPMRRAA